MKKISRKDALAAGLKRYFTGKPCSRGHIAERSATNRTCFLCSNKAASKSKAMKALEREAYLASQGITLRQTALNKGFRRYFTGKQCAHGHIEERRTSDAKCVECVKIKNRRRRAENPEYFKRCVKEFHERNPYAKRAAENKRRALKAGSGGQHSNDEIKQLLALQRNKCAYCKISIAKTGHHADHIMPLSRGGGNEIENIQILCARCNLTKSASDPIDFANKRMGMLL